MSSPIVVFNIFSHGEAVMLTSSFHILYLCKIVTTTNVGRAIPRHVRMLLRLIRLMNVVAYYDNLHFGNPHVRNRGTK